ncbi:HAMP domain-containing histidine kinase [Leptolyngbya sp. FACHB-36]|uniref:histidine kinase dimerization/phospho-acceptor domain-containing protein n=1 Tax=Leptolyngbya sp. FACHB-36 TaxID=2692808 RepID=UPI0016801988|nr:HAMP domain-containing histidine kinase [Leptolyngbya sp. FACHB-36]
MPKWLLPTLSEILALSDPTWAIEASERSSSNRVALQRVRAEREWSGAIAALSVMLQQKVTEAEADGTEHPNGLVLSGPLPVLSQPDLMANLSAWTLTANALDSIAWLPLQLLPAAELAGAIATDFTSAALPLLPGDPLATEQFCLVLTPWFSLVMVLGEGLTGTPAFMFSFMPEVVERAWEAIRPRILLTSSHQIQALDALVRQFPPLVPNYQTVMQFSRLLLEHLPEPLEEDGGQRVELHSHESIDPELIPDAPPLRAPDVELLQAIAHEVRTPLTTIRTLTRLLLKRTDLPPDAVKRLEVIDRECSEQIDRFGLLFRAAELETTSAQPFASSLTRTSLAQVFQQSIPRWKQQASQRGLTLDVVLPQKMPAVVSDPSMLDKALTSLIERFTRRLAAGSHIRVEVMLAGSQLKLQLQSQPEAHTASSTGRSHHESPLKSIGRLLMFQPETGSLSLNMAVTKTLFQSLGGKLIVRQRPEQGEVMTVFLPLEMSVLDA